MTVAQKEPTTDKGLACPVCGCRDFSVIETREGTGYVRRRRECRHCGKRVTTTERIVGYER